MEVRVGLAGTIPLSTRIQGNPLVVAIRNGCEPVRASNEPAQRRLPGARRTISPETAQVLALDMTNTMRALIRNSGRRADEILGTGQTTDLARGAAQNRQAVLVVLLHPPSRTTVLFVLVRRRSGPFFTL